MKKNFDWDDVRRNIEESETIVNILIYGFYAHIIIIPIIWIIGKIFKW